MSTMTAQAMRKLNTPRLLAYFRVIRVNHLVNCTYPDYSDAEFHAANDWINLVRTELNKRENV